MATYDNLPVYKAAYDLLQDITMLRKQMSREYKYTLGEKLMNETVEMIISIFRANVSRIKKELIMKSREHIEIIRLLMRLLKDLKQLSLKRFIAVNLKIECVSKQLTGWMNSCK